MAALSEIAARFGQESELRRVQMESLRWLVELAWRAGVQRVVVNGSFATNKLEPNDVDSVLLIGPDFPRDAVAEAELLAGLVLSTWNWWIRKPLSGSRRRPSPAIAILSPRE